MWITWFSNLFLMSIILANFLIAEVGVTFEKVQNLGNVFLNVEKAKFNKLIFQIESFFGYHNRFSVIIFSQDKELLESDTTNE